jgi:hypothetical protein
VSSVFGDGASRTVPFAGGTTWTRQQVIGSVDLVRRREPRNDLMHPEPAAVDGVGASGAGWRGRRLGSALRRRSRSQPLQRERGADRGPGSTAGRSGPYRQERATTPYTPRMASGIAWGIWLADRGRSDSGGSAGHAIRDGGGRHYAHACSQPLQREAVAVEEGAAGRAGRRAGLVRSRRRRSHPLQPEAAVVDGTGASGAAWADTPRGRSDDEGCGDTPCNVGRRWRAGVALVVRRGRTHRGAWSDGEDCGDTPCNVGRWWAAAHAREAAGVCGAIARNDPLHPEEIAPVRLWQVRLAIAALHRDTGTRCQGAPGRGTRDQSVGRLVRSSRPKPARCGRA